MVIIFLDFCQIESIIRENNFNVKNEKAIQISTASTVVVPMTGGSLGMQAVYGYGRGEGVGTSNGEGGKLIAKGLFTPSVCVCVSHRHQ